MYTYRSIEVFSPFPSLWNFTWFMIQLGAVCLGLEQIDTNYFYLISTEWVSDIINCTINSSQSVCVCIAKITHAWKPFMPCSL